jgi:hypothetical protein
MALLSPIFAQDTILISPRFYSSLQRRCSWKKASRAASSSGIVLLDHLIRAQAKLRRDREPERLGGLEASGPAVCVNHAARRRIAW